MIHFPDLDRMDTMEAPVVASISGFAAAVILPLSVLLAAVVAGPALVIVACAVFNALSNFWRRWKWSRSFDGRLSRRAAVKLLQAHAKDYRLHVQHYSGGFDRACLAPATVLEQLSSGKCFAIYPASWKIAEDCTRKSVEVIEDRGIRDDRS